MRLKLKVNPDTIYREDFYLDELKDLHDYIDNIFYLDHDKAFRDGFVKMTLVDMDVIDHYGDIGDVIRIDQETAHRAGVEPGDYLVLGTEGEFGRGIEEEWVLRAKKLDNDKYDPYAPQVKIKQAGEGGIGRIEVVKRMKQTWEDG